MLASILGAALLLPSSLLALPTLSPRQTETEADSAELTLPSRLPQKGTASLTDIKVEGNWTTIQCTAGSLTDARINEVDPNRRWVDSAADDAWKNLMDNWNVWRAANPTSTYPFVNFASNFFHATDQAACQYAQNNADCPLYQCDDTNHPAGWIIMNSMHNIWAYYNTITGAMQTKALSISSSIVPFQEAFAPVNKPPSGLTIGMDVLFGVVGLFTAGAWQRVHNVIEAGANLINHVLSFKLFAKEERPTRFEAYKDASLVALGSTYAATQRYTAAVNNAPDMQEMIRPLSNQMWLANKNAFGAVLSQLMSGFDAANTTALYEQITEGMALPLRPTLGSDMEAVAEQILYGSLMRLVWQMPNNDGNQQIPYVLYIPNGYYDCGSGKLNPVPLPGDGEDVLLASLFDYQDLGGQAGATYCDEFGNSFFLLNAGQAPFISGITKENLDGRFGGVTIKTVTQSTVKGFINNGFKYNTGLNNAPNEGPLDAWGNWGNTSFGPMVGAPGFFNFPICFLPNKVLANIERYKNGEFGGGLPAGYPCQDDTLSETTKFNNHGLNGYVPGNCGVHFEVFHNDLKDADGNMIEVGAARGMDLRVVDSEQYILARSFGADITNPAPDRDGGYYVDTPRLPRSLRYRLKEKVGEPSNQDVIEFSYGDAIWASNTESCGIGPYDYPSFQGDCGFTC